MKNKNLGFILIAIGVILLIWTGFTYVNKEKSVEVGSTQVSSTLKDNVNWSPFVGSIALIVGLSMLVAGNKN